MTALTVQKDTAGKPIFVLHGTKLFYQGKTEAGAHVWQAESKPVQLVVTPEEMNYIEGFDNLVTVATNGGRQ